MVFDEQADLLDQVVAEQIGARDRGRVGAGTRNMTKAEVGVDLSIGKSGKAHLGVEGADAGVGRGTAHGVGELSAQEIDCLGVEHGEAVHGGGGIGECLGLWRVGGEDLVLFHVGSSSFGSNKLPIFCMTASELSSSWRLRDSIRRISSSS